MVQDVILAILGGVTQYATPFIADDSDTARNMDHITVEAAKNRARYAFDASKDSLQDNRALGLTQVPTRCQQPAVALLVTLVHHCSASVLADAARMFCKIASAHGICREVHYSIPEFATLAGGHWVNGMTRPWPRWGWVSTTSCNSPGRPTSSCSPPQAMSSRCVPQTCDTATHVA